MLWFSLLLVFLCQFRCCLHLLGKKLFIRCYLYNPSFCNFSYFRADFTSSLSFTVYFHFSFLDEHLIFSQGFVLPTRCPSFLGLTLICWACQRLDHCLIVEYLTCFHWVNYQCGTFLLLLILGGYDTLV